MGKPFFLDLKWHVLNMRLEMSFTQKRSGNGQSCKNGEKKLLQQATDFMSFGPSPTQRTEDLVARPADEGKIHECPLTPTQPPLAPSLKPLRPPSSTAHRMPQIPKQETK